MITFTLDGASMPEIDTPAVDRWIRRVAGGYGYEVGAINYIFCSDARILEVNRQFLGHDYYTDIITFDYSTPGRLNGDIYISLETMTSNREEYGDPRELYRLLIHGILHLTGQEDKTPQTRAEMTRKEDKALAALTI